MITAYSCYFHTDMARRFERTLASPSSPNSSPSHLAACAHNGKERCVSATRPGSNLRLGGQGHSSSSSSILREDASKERCMRT